MDRHPDRAAALASLRERWGAAAPRPATEVFGALAVAPHPAANLHPAVAPHSASNPAPVAPRSRPAPAATDRTIPTGFPALDALVLMAVVAVVGLLIAVGLG